MHAPFCKTEPFTFTTSQVGERYDVCDVTRQKGGMDDNFATLEAYSRRPNYQLPSWLRISC